MVRATDRSLQSIVLHRRLRSTPRLRSQIHSHPGFRRFLLPNILCWLVNYLNLFVYMYVCIITSSIKSLEMESWWGWTFWSEMKRGRIFRWPFGRSKWVLKCSLIMFISFKVYIIFFSNFHLCWFLFFFFLFLCFPMVSTKTQIWKLPDLEMLLRLEQFTVHLRSVCFSRMTL